jgi:hypothetical protein
MGDTGKSGGDSRLTQEYSGKIYRILPAGRFRGNIERFVADGGKSEENTERSGI